MLSVQVPGCAGMERLGAPGGPRLRHDHRHHHSTLEWEKQQRLQAMVGRLQEMVEQETRARSAAAAERLGLPPSIRLPDGEYGQDAHLQIRVPYQQAELTRSSFQPPPNKCVSDVPEWAGAAEAGPARRAAAKKDGLLQKATRWWVRMGARPPAPFPAAPPPCVMVPRRALPPPPDAADCADCAEDRADCAEDRADCAEDRADCAEDRADCAEDRAENCAGRAEGAAGERD
ncbi:uncharacterized protein LOC106719084 [Papilio machaon]|uniref:uncharacterized protein LOC106719084 n=1 Tax=Papilio machaon TaxID=76193 RepID=UPI001E6630C3|nr:uncharacterized protein LOC106719084 [Papilio machaon]